LYNLFLKQFISFLKDSPPPKKLRPSTSFKKSKKQKPQWQNVHQELQAAEEEANHRSNSNRKKKISKRDEDDDAIVEVEAVPICRTWVNTTRK
jgi:hypothetical protein